MVSIIRLACIHQTDNRIRETSLYGQILNPRFEPNIKGTLQYETFKHFKMPRLFSAFYIPAR